MIAFLELGRSGSSALLHSDPTDKLRGSSRSGSRGGSRLPGTPASPLHDSFRPMKKGSNGSRNAKAGAGGLGALHSQSAAPLPGIEGMNHCFHLFT